MTKVMTMSNMADTIKTMNDRFGVNDWVIDKLQSDDFESVEKLLEFRIKDLLAEEFLETQAAFKEKNAEELVDGLVDLIVIAMGTLDILDVDTHKAFNKVMKANLSKEAGIKPERPNPLGLPDLLKPEGWVGPDHRFNHGLLPLIWEE